MSISEMPKFEPFRDEGDLSDPNDRDPDLFEAAFRDNVHALHTRQEVGASLSFQEGDNGFTPLHIAAIYRSHNFIRAAIKLKDVDLWVRDHNGRLPFDLCSGFRDFVGMRLFLSAMQNDEAGPQPGAKIHNFPHP